MGKISAGFRYTNSDWQRIYGHGTLIQPPAPNTIGAAELGTTAYPIPADAIYIATNGSDSSTGSKTAPKATLAAALATVPAGGTIVYRAGSYNEGTDTQGGSLTPGIYLSKQVTIQNYPGEQVWLDGSVPFASNAWTAGTGSDAGRWSAPYTRLFDRSPTFTSGQADGTGASTGAGGWFIDSNYPAAGYPDMILMDGTQLTQVQNKTDLATGKFWVEGATTTGYWFQATKVWIADDPTGHEMRYSNKTRFGQTAADGVVIRGIGIRRYATYTAGFGLLYITNSNTVLENIRFEDTSAYVMQFAGGTTNTVQNCTARRIGFAFCGSNQSDDIRLIKTDLQQCNWNHYNTQGPTAGVIRLAKCQGVTVDSCIVSNNNFRGFWCDQTTNNPHVINTRFENNTQHAIDLEGASYAIVANCVIANNGGWAIWINDSDQTRIWNNTIIDNLKSQTSGAPFQIGQSTRRASLPSYSFMIDNRLTASGYYDDPAHQFRCHRFEFYNNVIVRSGSYGQGMFFCQNQGDTTEPNLTFADFGPNMDSNVYYWASTPQYPFVRANGQSVNVDFSLAAFTAASGQETHGTFVTSNPVNQSQQVSPAFNDKATALPSDIATLIGQTSGTKQAGAFLVGGTS